jgi:glycosyltransferase involved in cell wall biosynthesis
MLSIVIPSYNDAKNISLAVASADQIKYVNEIIVVDDCSTDNTKSLIKEISTNCKKIKYFKNSINKGSGLTFLKGLEKITNNYVLMLNSDDFFLPRAIEKLFEYTTDNRLDLGYGKMAIKKNTGIHKYSHPGYKNHSYTKNENELIDLLVFDMYIPSFGAIMNFDEIKKFYNKSYYQKLNNDYGKSFKAHDYDLFLNLAKKKKKIGFYNEIVCVWCKSQNSQSGLKYFESGDACFESAFLFNKYFKNESLSNETLSLIESRIKGKYNHIKKSIPKTMNFYKHYESFLLNIENMKKLNS